MAQRDASKTAISFIDDKTVLLSLGDLSSAQYRESGDLDEEAPQMQELKDSLLMVLRQIAGPKPH